MSQFSIVVNNRQLKHIGDVNESRYDLQLEARYSYSLPGTIPALRDYNWAVRVKQLIIIPHIVTIHRNNDFVINVKDESGNENTFYLADFIGYADNLQHLLDVLNDILEDKGRLYFTFSDDQIGFDVYEGYEISLSKGLFNGLGFGGYCGKPAINCSDEKHVLMSFTEGKYETYRTDSAFDKVFYPHLAQVYLDVIQPGVVGNRFAPLLYTCDPGASYNPSGTYKELNQSPIDVMEIYFKNEKEDPLYFSCHDKNDFLFSIELEFKRLEPLL